MKKTKYKLRKSVDRSYMGRSVQEYVSYDIMRVRKNGEELIVEFQPKHRRLAALCVKLLNAR